MPNIREQRVGPLGDKTPSALPGDETGFYIKASNGREFVLTKRQIRTHYLTTSGNAAVRKAAVIAWIRSQIVASLGSDQIDRNAIQTDFTVVDGTPNLLEITG